MKINKSFRMVHLNKGPSYHSTKLKGWAYHLYCANAKVLVPKTHHRSSNHESVTCIKCLENYSDSLDSIKRLVQEEVKFQRNKYLERQKKEIRKVKVPVTTYREIPVEL